MAQSNPSGCFSPIAIFVILLSSVFSMSSFLGISQSASPRPAQAPTLPPAVEVVLAPIGEPVTLEQMDITYTVLDARLHTLQLNRHISLYEIELTAEDEFVIQLNTVTDILTDVLPVLTTPGYLEFVDFSGVDVASVSGYVGVQVATTDSMERYLLDDGDDIFPTILTDEHIASVDAFIDDFGNHALQIDLTDEGATLLETFSADHIGAGLAIVLDNEVLSVPIIQTQISSPIILTGAFTQAEVESLAIQLNSKPLPVPLEFISIDQP